VFVSSFVVVVVVVVRFCSLLDANGKCGTLLFFVDDAVAIPVAAIVVTSENEVDSDVGSLVVVVAIGDTTGATTLLRLLWGRTKIVSLVLFSITVHIECLFL